jgi:hypothetical protein
MFEAEKKEDRDMTPATMAPTRAQAAPMMPEGMLTPHLTPELTRILTATCMVERRAVVTNAMLMADYYGWNPEKLPRGQYVAERAFIAGNTQQQEQRYNFLFWTLDGQPQVAHNSRTIWVKAAEHHKATKWYLPHGGSGAQHVHVFAFSMSQNRFVNESPLVNGSAVVIPTSDGPVTLAAKGSIATGEPFHHWWVTTTPLGNSSYEVTIAQNVAAYAIAYYGAAPLPRFEWPWWKDIVVGPKIPWPPPYEIPGIEPVIQPVVSVLREQQTSIAEIAHRLEQLELQQLEAAAFNGIDVKEIPLGKRGREV